MELPATLEFLGRSIGTAFPVYLVEVILPTCGYHSFINRTERHHKERGIP
jgi:hypothetical protein